MRLALIVQRYGEIITGGAEQLCRQLADHLKDRCQVEILTTTAKDYTDWKNYYIPGRERLDGLVLRRFATERKYNPAHFRWQTRLLFRMPHSPASELNWIRAQGPYTPSLVEFVEANAENYDLFYFFSYRYYPCFFGLPAVADKSVLVPTAEHDRTIYLKSYRELFHRPRAIVYLTPEEKRLINEVSHNEQVTSRVIGIGITPPSAASGDDFRAEFNIHGPYLLYIGRIDENKGCATMFEHMRRYFKERPGSPLKLVLVGFRAMDIEPLPRIVHIGYLEDREKFNAIAGAEALIMPSRYESLSIVTLEGMALGRPVLVNGECEVLLGHAERSGGALAYRSYEDLASNLDELMGNVALRAELGAKGKQYVQSNYTWPIVIDQHLGLIENLMDARQNSAPPLTAAAPVGGSNDSEQRETTG